MGATVTSRDGLVRATLDATGALADLEFAPTAFEHTDPATLARTVLALVHEGGRPPMLADAAPPVPPRPTPKRARHAR